MSTGLFGASYSPPDPEPAGQPDVLAESPQELCEVLHYFRAYQISADCANGFAWAFMFDKTSCPRDYIDTNVVIACAGGSKGQDAEAGEMILIKDHSATDMAEQLSLRDSTKDFNSVVLVAGDGNLKLPSKPPHIYHVLDHFKPTAAAYHARLNSLPKELRLTSSGKAKDASVMTCGDGDIMIMHGAEIQKYYEHSVENAGKLRFAFTGLYIDLDSPKDADKPKYEVKSDEGVYDDAALGMKA